MWNWPLLNATPMMPDAPGRFGAVRRYDIHTGVDLYTERGTLVVAVEDGVVVKVEGFTGPNADDPSPWWNDTQAVLVEGASGVVVYGEIASRVVVGDRLKAGDVVGVVEQPVLKNFKGRPMVMLHLELMPIGERKTYWWQPEDDPPPPMLNPEPLLIEVAGSDLTCFDLGSYDGIRFR